MPMQYALQFKQDGYDVKYIVDVDKEDTLSRPECQFSEIPYPYPEWIEEIAVPAVSLRAIFPSLFFKKILTILKNYDVVVLSGWYISLAPYLPASTKVIFLPHGSDLDTWCDAGKASELAKVGRFKSFYFIKKMLASAVIKKMISGLSRANLISYFPPGLNLSGDQIIQRLKNKDCVVVGRYDVSIDKFKNLNFEKNTNDSLVLCSAVRFDYLEVAGVNNKYLKGNDLIIKAIARFYKEVNSNIKVVFFNKGMNLKEAKKLCNDVGISHLIEWKEQMPLKDLLQVMRTSDICFDQVGRHWMGAVGVYGLLLGKPVIANYRPEILDVFFDGKSPVFQATNEQEIFDHLIHLNNSKNREAVCNESREFALKNFDSARIYNLLLMFLKQKTSLEAN